jgi:hypothetical protein
MVDKIEAATENVHLVEVCRKHRVNPMLMTQPSMLFSRVAEKLYAQHPDAQYAVVSDIPEKIELVQYDSIDELTDYCKTNNMPMMMTVNKDGSNMVYPTVPGTVASMDAPKKPSPDRGNDFENSLQRKIEEMEEKTGWGSYADEKQLDAFLGSDEMVGYYQKTERPGLFNKLIKALAAHMHDRGAEAWNSLPTIDALKYDSVKVMADRFPEETKESLAYFLKGAVEVLTADESDIKEREVNEYGPLIVKWKSYLNDKDVVKAATKGIEYAADKVGFWLNRGEPDSAKEDAERIKAKLGFVKELSPKAHDTILADVGKKYPKEVEFVKQAL